MAQWLMGELLSHLDAAPPLPALDYLKEAFSQILDLPAWVVVEPPQTLQGGRASGMMVTGRLVPADRLDTLVDAAEKLLASAPPGWTSPAGPTPPPLSGDAPAWLRRLRSLRAEFERHAAGEPRLRHLIIQPITLECLPEELSTGMSAGSNQIHRCALWSWVEHNPEVAYLFGPPGEVAAFLSLGEQAWLALPLGADRDLTDGEPGDHWLRFVYAVLRQEFPTYLRWDRVLRVVGSPDLKGVFTFNPGQESEAADPYWEGRPRFRQSQLRVDPFSASVAALDAITSDEYVKRVLEAERRWIRELSPRRLGTGAPPESVPIDEGSQFHDHPTAALVQEVGADESLRVDIRELPIEPPAGTPSPLREAFDAVAHALRSAAGILANPATSKLEFEEEARGLSIALSTGRERYAPAELLLQAAADGACSHQDALNAVCRINDHCGHVMLGIVPWGQAAAHVRAAPGFDLGGLLAAMRRQVSRAAVQMQFRDRQPWPSLSGQPELPGALSPTQTQPTNTPTARPDGVEGGCWLWWQGRRHDIPKGVTYRLIAFMWDRDSSCYDDLEGPVFEDALMPDSLRARVSEANKVLRRVGILWRLKTDSTSRTLTKHVEK
jgi:hypothetical protein